MVLHSHSILAKGTVEKAPNFSLFLFTQDFLGLVYFLHHKAASVKFNLQVDAGVIKNAKTVINSKPFPEKKLFQIKVIVELLTIYLLFLPRLSTYNLTWTSFLSVCHFEILHSMSLRIIFFFSPIMSAEKGFL